MAEKYAASLRPLGDLKDLGRRWAICAGREVLRDIDQPSFESVQTCEVLALYWFSAGETLRNTMFSGKYQAIVVGAAAVTHILNAQV